MFWKSRRPVEATTRARTALGIAPDPAAQVEEFQAGTALAIAAPAKPFVPSDPGSHMRYAEKAVDQMDADEAAILAEIEQERAAHAAKIETLEGLLAGVRKTRSFYATAPGFLAPETAAIKPPRPPKPSRKRVRGSTAAEADRKPEGQEQAHE